jgi:hypothetical protein
MKLHPLTFLALLCAGAVCADETIIPASNDDEPGAKAGARPYEMDWANRTDPEHPQLVDFEDLAGWRARCLDGAEARLYRSKQEMIFGEYTGKVVYSGANSKSSFVLEPPSPIPIPGTFTGVNLWVRGNSWGWVDPPATARVGIRVLVRDAKDELYQIDLGVEDFDYWCVMHATCVSPDGAKRLYEPVGQPNDGVIDFPARFVGIEVAGCSNKEPARLYFDALSFYEIPYPSPTFDPIPENLPWPTTPDTILPTTKDPRDAPEFVYTPNDGTLSDLTVRALAQSFQPCWKGGITFEIHGKPVRPGEAGGVTRLLNERGEGNKKVYAWELTSGDTSVRYTYTIETKNKSCIIDVTAEGDATQFDIGLAKGLLKAKTVFIPYLTYGDDWPRVVSSAGDEGPAGQRALFLLAVLDYYNSKASELFGAPRIRDADTIGYAGGALYKPTTAGKRNPLHERLFVNVSGDVQEVLPNIPNPSCDTGEIAREYLWRNIGAVFQNEMLTKYKAYGIDKFIACHHEVGWREAGESFTLRDRPGPSIGDDALAKYGEFVRGLGYRFGTYTNYVDFAPVNANWNENDVCLNPDGSWQRAWPRTYALKPLRAAEKEAYYAPRIHERYGTTAQYCDVHTAYTPWGRTDYDARTPGAGMFRTQFNAFARLLSNESTAHHGPVFSEGNYHWFYAGIVDGDYATMIPYGRGWQVPHIVDFDLLKMHPKMTDFGMGMPQMYYGAQGDWMKDRSRLSPYFDRFHAATIAFGHIGFLSEEWGFEGTLKSYYLLQALQQRYAMTPVASIGYFDGNRIVDTSTAIATDAYKRQQVCATYESGLTTWCNLSFDQDWTVEVNGQPYQLPPASFAAYKPDDLLAYSAMVNGQRHELVRCPDYLYLDSRDQIVRTPMITTRGMVAVKRDGDHAWWIIPATKCEEVTVSLAWLKADPDSEFSATANNQAGDTIGPAAVLRGVGEVTVMMSAEKDAMKYHLVAAPGAHDARAVSKIDLPRRELLPTTTMPVTVSVAAPVDADVSAATVVWACGNPGAEDWSTGKGPLSRATDAEAATASLVLVMPKEAPLRKRCWYRFWTEGPGGVKSGARWVDATAVPAFDMAIAAGATTVRARDLFSLSTTIRNNFPGPVTSSLSLRLEGKAEPPAQDFLPTPLTKSLDLAVGASQPILWEFRLPETPVIAEIKFRAEAAGQATEVIHYLRTQPAQWVVADLTKTPFRRGQCLRGGAEGEYDPAGTGVTVDTTEELCGGERLAALFTHPPYTAGVGYAFAVFDAALPESHPRLEFALGFRSGSTTQDGCIFKVVVLDQAKPAEIFSEPYATLESWARRSADLTAFAGRPVQIKLVTDVGPNNNSYSDWAAWGAPRIVMDDPAIAVEVMPEAPVARLAPPPEPLKGLTRADLAKVVKARLLMETAGVNDGSYTSYVYLNGVKIGATPTSASDTQWGPAEMTVPQEALATIGPVNAVVIRNPGSDYMKIRSLCLRFELADGRHGSSWIDLGPYCSAAGWAFEEGASVPVGRDLPTIILSIPIE